MNFILKYFDKFLKVLKTDRNTFLTYILTLITIYILIDRITELLFILTTGISVSYWGPIKYTFALACPIFAFFLSGPSTLASSGNLKIVFVNLYCIALYVIGISMVVQWLNLIAWISLLSLPNYVEFIEGFWELIKPAFQASALYLPLTTFYPVFKWLYAQVDDTRDLKDSIIDYPGIDINDNKEGTGAYACETVLGRDQRTGKAIKIPEQRRFEASLIVGASGSGKTSLIFEPMIAKDLEKKFFFREISKEMGFTSLRTGIAHLNRPYDNEYLNKNFSMSMLIPTEGKEKIYEAYISKMICAKTGTSNYIYKNVGITAISPDYESTSHVIEMAQNFDFKYNIIDPLDSNSIGLNPFTQEDPSKTAIIITSILLGMHNTVRADAEVAFREHTAIQAVENLSILLKVMYPILNNGDLPTIEDMLKMLNNSDLVEDMCREMEAIPELADKYALQIGYFKKHFYKNGENRTPVESFVYAATTQLDGLLRIPGVKNILCNRTNNIDFDQVLANGEVTFLCTRRGDLGATAHKAFGLFFLLMLQYSILKRPGNEKNRIPHFLYIDEFADYVCPATEAIFTLYRKYRVGAIISAQNLSQLSTSPNSQINDKQVGTLFANTSTKLLLGTPTSEERKWWVDEFGHKRDWLFNSTYDTSKVKYEDKLGSIKWGWKNNFEEGKIETLKFKECAYKLKNAKGKDSVGFGNLDFVSSKYKEPRKSKKYNFSKFTQGIAEGSTAREEKPSKFNPRKVDFSSDDGDVDPIKSDSTDSKYLFDNEDAIIFDFKKNKNTNN